jgi:anti-sigma regulatory factor (Ser/Thr protein kinase)
MSRHSPPPASCRRNRRVAIQLLPAPGQPARDETGEPGAPLTVTCGHSVSLCLTRELTEVKRARAAAGTALSGWGLGEHAEVTQLILSELVTNAIRHGAGPVRVRISHDPGHLHVGVHDDGPGRPARRPVTEDDESGHGLELIDGLLREHGGTRWVAEDKAGGGKTVQVAIRLPDGPGPEARRRAGQGGGEQASPLAPGSAIAAASRDEAMAADRQ